MERLEDSIMSLKINCNECFGLCCVALYFSKIDGFPENKDSGKPCLYLKEDFKCKVHDKLMEKGLKGCTIFECFGAGQKVSKIIYKGENWRQNSKIAKEMFEVFLVVRQLHEMQWYLTEAYELNAEKNVKDEIELLIKETEALTLLAPKEILRVDLVRHREKVNIFLRQTSELVRKALNKNSMKRKKNTYFGVDFRNTNVKGADFRGAYLIGANFREKNLAGADFIGADLRDSDFSKADLSKSIFLTQGQLNSAKGDKETKLPKKISRPKHWI